MIVEGGIVWPFTKKKAGQEAKVLPFKDGEAFFEYQCKYCETRLVQNQGEIALVIDAAKEFGVPSAVKVEEDGRQLAAIKVASKDGGFIIPAYTATGKGDKLMPGDVVIWVPVEYSEEVGESAEDPRLGWVGYIVAKVKPEIDMSSPNPTLLCRYD